MKCVIVAGFALSFCTFGIYAQQALLGKYSGTYTFAGARSGRQAFGISIEITRVENGKLKGSFTAHQRYCGGTMPIEGTYHGNKLEFTAAGGIPTRDCLERKFEVVSDGNKLLGQMLGQNGEWVKIQLSK